MNSTGDYYDPDEDARDLSPGLVPIKVNYVPEETPPPFIPISSSSSSSSASAPGDSNDDRHTSHLSAHPPKKLKKKKKKRRRKGQTRQCYGDALLMISLDPNRPDIARQVGRHALNSASQSEAESEVEKDMSGDGNDEDEDGAGRTEEKRENRANATELKSTATAALNDVLMDDHSPEKPLDPARLAMGAVMNGAMNGKEEPHNHCGDNGIQLVSLNLPQDPTAASRSLQPAVPLKIMAAPSEAKTEKEDESITTSPALAKFAISAAEANPDSTLPAMQTSPPRSASTHSPDGTQSLPSLKTALSQIADRPLAETPNGVSPFPQNPAQSPTMARSPYINGTVGPSPSLYSHPSPSSSKDLTSMSPPGYPSNPSHWRSTTKEGSYTAASPASTATLSSVTSYPTSKDITSPESIATPQMLHDSSLPAANGTLPSTLFKCTHPKCNAPPFQTQYLLNSHANVHSSSRPHFCPVKICPRSMGGMGFKRKNEMIRHGLVHDSPGYVCPFCVDQQHRYPRPDNLQRHVRVHHPDKKRDDPQLQSVLASRSGEGGRNRRRRIGT